MKISIKKNPLIILAAILLVSVCLRFYNLSGVPSGLHADEASQGYNAFSLFKTGRDMYGRILPILFRASGSYQTPIYTYLSIIPVNLLGNTIFSIRFISALSGVALVALTYFLLKLWGQKGLIAATVIAISPWAVHFSRVAVEANLALTIFASSIIVFGLSLKKPKYLPLASLLLGISTHAYYSERVIAVLFLPLFILLFRKIFLKYKSLLVASLIIFAITQVPHIYILQTGALT
ncbi:MAG: glycosyltransferase family 39 protein, partial [Candidatus Woesebacteria bacterium]|nr:glycosyltransferase family 39 protein [Candidatus Woesebacteria bacterium]